MTTNIDLNKVNKVILGIEDTKKILKYKWKQLLSQGPEASGLVYFIEGISGIGKTQIMSQIVKEMNEEDKNLNASLILTNFSGKEANELGNGLPYLDPETKISHFARAEDFPELGNGILFIDEFNRLIDHDVKSLSLSMLMDREVNGKKLSKGFLIVTAGNPFGSNVYETMSFDRALQQRIRVIELRPTHDEVYQFLSKKYGEDNFLIQYYKKNPDIVSLNDSSSGVSPRTFEKGIQDLYLFKTVNDTKKDVSLVENLLKINFGSLSNPILSFLNDNKILTFKDVLENNQDILKTLNKSDLPLIEKINEELIPYLYHQCLSEKGLSPDNKKGITFFLGNIGLESQESFINKFYTYEYEGPDLEAKVSSFKYNKNDSLANHMFDYYFYEQEVFKSLKPYIDKIKKSKDPEAS